MDRRDFIQTASILAATTAATAANASRSAPAVSQLGEAPAPADRRTATRLAQNAVAGRRTLSDTARIPEVSQMLNSVASMVSTTAPAAGGGSIIPEVLKPIDVGAEALLTPVRAASLIYSPMEVEYHVNSMEEHIKACLSLREKAQQLEVLAVAQRLDLLLDQKLTEFLERMSQFSSENDRKVSGTLFDPTIAGNRVVSGDAAAAYFDNRQQIEAISINVRKDVNQARLTHMKEAGSGNNNVERFDFLKELFNRELVQAYQRARSISYGLKAIYNVDKPVPDLSDVGYLNKLTLWHRDVYYDLERRVMMSAQSTVVFGLRKLADGTGLPGFIADADFKQQRDAGTLKFNLPANAFDTPTLKLKNVRLRGLDVYIWADPLAKLDYIRVRVELPDQTIRDGLTNIWANKPSVNLPAVTFPQGEVKAELRREVHNANPIGDWTLQLDKKTIADNTVSADAVSKNIFLALRVASDVW